MTEPIGATPARAQTDSLQDSAWQSGVARPLLIALQATCLMAGLWAIALTVSETPGDLRLTPFLVFLAALAGAINAHWLAQPAQRLVGKVPFQLAQLLVLLAAVRLLTWGLTGAWPTVATLRGWILEPWGFFDGVFLFTAVLCGLAWHRAAVVAGIFYRLGLTPGELAYDNERRAGSFWRTGHLPERSLVSRADLLEHYVSQWMLGGVFLALCAAATRVQVGERLSLSVFDTGIPPIVVAAGVLYFLIGLLLTSQARLALLRAHWLLDGVELPERLPARWRRFSLAIIAGVGLLATLLPLGSTWQLGAIVNAVAMAVMRVALLVAFLIATAFALVMRLFEPQQPLPEMPQELAAPPPIPEAAPLWETPPWLGGAVLWLVLLIALLVALRLLLGKEGLDLTRRRFSILLATLWAHLRSWMRGLKEAASSLQLSLPGRRSLASDESVRQPWRFVRVAGLSPRDQVRYFYLSTLRRASEQGIARRPAQTPQEFAQDLEQGWPETEIDLEALTAAFVVARYDVAEISPGEAQEVRSVWERIKRALRGKRKSEEGAVDELH